MRAAQAAIAHGGVAAIAWVMSENRAVFSSPRMSRAAMARIATVTRVRASLELASLFTAFVASDAQTGRRGPPPGGAEAVDALGGAAL